MYIKQKKLNEIINCFSKSSIGKLMFVIYKDSSLSESKDIIMFLRFEDNKNKKLEENKNCIEFKIFNNGDGEIVYWLKNKRMFLEYFKIPNDYDADKIVNMFFKIYTESFEKMASYKYENIQIHFSKAEDGFEFS